MVTTGFSTSLLFDQSPEDVYNAINNVRGWWSEEIDGSTDKLNSEWRYHYQDVHRCTIKIIELIPGKRVVWEVCDNYFSFTNDKDEWIGNKMVFDISKKGNQTQLHFIQEGLVPEYECYDICQNAWSTYLHKSLYGLITTGKGQPNGKDKPQTADEERLASGDFTSTFFVDQSPQEVYDAINNVRSWWQGEINGKTDTLNEEFDYRMKDVHYTMQRVIELTPGKRVVWKVVDSKRKSMPDLPEWKGTEIIFDIKEINNKTQLRFTHHGLVPALECYEDCSWAWGELMQKSLKSFIETGKGVNVFD